MVAAFMTVMVEMCRFGKAAKLLIHGAQLHRKATALFGGIIIHNGAGKGRKMNERGAKADHIYPRKRAALFKTLEIRFIRESLLDKTLTVN